MLNKFGKYCKKLRIDNDELLIDMASHLEVSSAFLSKVENGKKKPPQAWKDKIIAIYELEGVAKSEFEDCFFEAVNSESIDMSIFNNCERDLLLSFARKIDSLGEDRINAIKKIINNG